MTLEEACSEFEGLFGSVEVDPNGSLSPVVLCTGALGLVDHPPPVLCATADLAVLLWSRTAREWAVETCLKDGWLVDTKEHLGRYGLIWVTEPRLLVFKMTIQDGGGHRVASNRYAVYSLCAIVEKPQDVVAAATE